MLDNCISDLSTIKVSSNKLNFHVISATMARKADVITHAIGTISHIVLAKIKFMIVAEAARSSIVGYDDMHALTAQYMQFMKDQLFHWITDKSRFTVHDTSIVLWRNN